MARLSALPNEITLIIILHVLPDDIESFTSTCRKIYNLSTEHLERHRALKRKHAVYRYFDPYHSSYLLVPRCRPSQLLDEILKEHLTAFYVQEIWVCNWWGRWGTYGDEDLKITRPEHLHLPYSEGLMSRLREAVLKLVPQDEVSIWLNDIESGSEDPIVSLLLLLLPLLPNLSTLKFELLGDNQKRLHGTLCRIVDMKGPDAPLSRLRHVQTPNSLEIVGLRLLELFVTLPSIRSIHGQKLRDLNIEVYPDMEVDVAPRTSNLEDLTLTACLINSKRLFDFLETFKALRSFTHISDPRNGNSNDRIAPDDRRRKFDPFWIRSGLSAFARSTLESLTILTRDKERRFMGDIRSFKALRNLRTETQLLVRGFQFYDETSLARALPPNLETLELECSGLGIEMQIAKQISALAKLKRKHVPALREVEVLTRNGVKDFNTSQDEPGLTRRRGTVVAVNECYTYEAIVEACNNEGFDLHVKAFDKEVLHALDVDERSYWRRDGLGGSLRRY